MKIYLNNYKDNWLEFGSVKDLSRYFTSDNYYRQLLKVVKNKQTSFRGYGLRYER